MATLPEGPVPDFIAQAMKSALEDFDMKALTMPDILVDPARTDRMKKMGEFRSEWLLNREEGEVPIPPPYAQEVEMHVTSGSPSAVRKNSFVKEKWSATAVVRDFSQIAQFQIYSGNFSFDSYDPALSEGWELRVKQDYFRGVRRVNAELIGPLGKLKIRVGRDNRLWHVRMVGIDDVIEAFYTCFDLNLVTKPFRATTAKVRPISAYSDAELLEEVHARTMARVGDFRAKKPKPRVVTDNVIELDDVKRRLFDEEKVRRLIEAA